MRLNTATHATDEAVRDPKRWVWLLGGMWTFSVCYVAAAIYFLTGGALWTTFILPVHLFIFIPLMDMVFGENRLNPTAAQESAMQDDRFYMWMVYVLVAFGYGSFIGGMIFIGTQNLPAWANISILLGLGIQNGTLITLAHELGHKTHPLDRLAAKVALGGIGYGHFCAEHNLGHHKNVSTPDDCASARIGESVYQFALRELPGALLGGWRHEISRLKRRGLPTLSVHNEILQSYAITVVVGAVLVMVLGISILPWIILHHFLAWYGLTMVNYVEHYGLLRQRMPNGKYELCQPRHSWNTDHIVSNILQIQLQRHSDHHAHPMRPYQVLRTFDDIPRLPSGYPGCLAMASIPPLWFWVMDKRVLQWADGDLSKTNMFEPARKRLERRWATA